MTTPAPNHSQQFSFRVVIARIVRELNSETLHEIAFIYDKDEHLEKKKEVDGLTLFRDIIRGGTLDCNNGAHIAQLTEALKSFQRTDLVEKLTKYCSKWNIATTPCFTTTIGASETNTNMEQEDSISSTTRVRQKKVEGSVVLMRHRRSASMGINTTSGASIGRSQSFNRKRRKPDLGATDEGQLSLECDYCSGGEEGEDDEAVDPHNQQDEQHMKKAVEEAKKSPDKEVQVGTVIVDKEGKELGRGHNRMPKGCESLPWKDDESDLLTSKYPYVFHSIKAASKNAFENQKDTEGATIYTTLFPANTDAQWIAECGIKELVYLDNPYKRKTFAIAAKKIFDASGIKYRRMARELEGMH